jgi:tetratricopeptide (TPR) repeat protein
MQQRIRVKRSNPAQRAVPHGTRNRLLSTILTYLPGAWIDPCDEELIALYRIRYRMAMEERKHETAMIFLNKILELDPMNLEAKLCKGEIYHRILGDYARAIEQYNRVIRLTSGGRNDSVHTRAQAAMSEILELLS